MEKTSTHEKHVPRLATVKGVRSKSRISSSSSSTDVNTFLRIHLRLPIFLQWIPANWNWSKLKPVIRCAIAAWVSVVIFVIPKVEIWLGQVRFSHQFLASAYITFIKASFLILIGSSSVSQCSIAEIDRQLHFFRHPVIRSWPSWSEKL